MQSWWHSKFNFIEIRSSVSPNQVTRLIQQVWIQYQIFRTELYESLIMQDSGLQKFVLVVNDVVLKNVEKLSVDVQFVSKCIVQ